MDQRTRDPRHEAADRRRGTPAHDRLVKPGARPAGLSAAGPRTEPPGSTRGRLAPARPGNPGGQPRPARHAARSPQQAAARRSAATRRPATSAAKQQPSRRAEGPAAQGHWSMAHAPTARCTDHDERAQDRRGATGPDPRTAQSRSARSGGGSSRRILPGIGSRPAAADVNDGPVTMYAAGPEGMQDSRIWAASVLNRKRADSRAERPDTRAAMTAEPAGRRSRGVQRLGRATDRLPLPARKAGRRLCAVRADLPGLCQRHRRCVRPQIPGLSPGGLGPHLTSSGSPRRAFLRFPVCPPGSSRSSAFRWFPFVRRSPVRPLRPWPGSGSPSVSLRGPLPSSDLHGSAAARRSRRRWSRAAGTKVTSNAAPPARSRDPPALQMGSGRARWDAATEPPVTSGREPRAPQDTAAPEPPRSVVI